MKHTRTRVAFAAALVVLTVGLLYHSLRRHRRDERAAEAVGARDVHRAEARPARDPPRCGERKNPADTSPGGADVALGRALYETHCQVCHGADGTGKTAAGGGVFRPPLPLT